MTQVQQSISGSEVGSLRAPAMFGPTTTVRSQVADFAELTKPGIVRLVTMTSIVGFIVSAIAGPRPMGELVLTALLCVLGTALSAAGANALNQAIEITRDSLMQRTALRPLPAGRLPVRAGFIFGAGLSMIGVGVLWFGCGPVPALVSFATILSYVLLYTPLKPVTPLATIVGAVPGALPPLIGWTAASVDPAHSLLSPGGWSIFLIIFVWQIPHFLAIAWKYRHEYAAGGHLVLPVVDPTGWRTSWTILVWTITLVPVSLGPVVFMPERFGWLYAVSALGCAILMLKPAIVLFRRKDNESARRLFIASVIYLPLILLTMVADVFVMRVI